MSELVSAFLAQFDVPTLLLIAIVTLATSALHGATGVAGGILLSAVLALIIGVKPVVPVVSIALLVSHTTRALLNARDLHWPSVLAISLPAFPLVALGAWIYGRLEAPLIAAVLGGVILLSVPLRHWAARRNVRAGNGTLAGVGAVYGILSGVSVGPGMILVPFMLGTGIGRQAFVASLAIIAVGSNITRVAVFGAGDLYTTPLIMLGLFCGVFTIPGNWLGRTWLQSMTNERHGSIVDWLTLLGAANFFWLAWRGL